MSDLRKQIHDYYAAQALPAAKVDAILAHGRGEAKVVTLPQRRWPRLLALAASVALLAGVTVWRMSAPKTVSFAVFAPQVVEFFGTPPELPKRSQNPEELRAWLIAQGAPENFQIPEKLRGLKSFGCQVIEVQGKPAWLTCFWREKKLGVDEGELVHLLVARKSDFRDIPGIESTLVREERGWSFVSWSEGDLVYTLAAAAPLEKLRPFAFGSPMGIWWLAASCWL